MSIDTETIPSCIKAWGIHASGGLNICPAGADAATPIDTFDDLADDAAAATEHAAGGV